MKEVNPYATAPVIASHGFETENDKKDIKTGHRKKQNRNRHLKNAKIAESSILESGSRGTWWRSDMPAYPRK